MKFFQKYTAVLFSFMLICFLCACNYEVPTTAILKEQIYIRFNEPNFGGNWNQYRSVGVNTMTVALDTTLFVKPEPPIQLQEKLEFKENNNRYQPHLPQLDTKNNYIFKPRTEEPYLRKIDTSFIIKKGAADTTYGTVRAPTDYEQKLNFGTVNDITLSYNMDSAPQVDFSVTIKSGKAIVDHDRKRMYNFDVAWKKVHSSNYSNKESINLAVMADGYRADQMNEFRKYVEDAFETPANFHYTEERVPGKKHVPNDFFEKYWGRINVFMFETASLHAGIDTVSGRNDVMNFFQLNSGNKDGIPFLNSTPMAGYFQRMRDVITTNSYKTGLDIKDVDAYIIFANDPVIWSYSFAYYIKAGNRNQQPVTSVIIQAPVTSLSVDDDNFHNDEGGVLTHAIAHELGHAMGSLLDEYDVGRGKWVPYLESFRNISDNSYPNLKWQRLISLNSAYYNPISNPVPTLDNDQKLVNLKEPGFIKHPIDLSQKNPFYIPTINSTMRAIGKYKEYSKNYQFGPVNTYHMEGSFKTRIGKIPPQDLQYDGTSASYEWQGYSFEDFMKEWLPDDFNNPKKEDK